MGLIGYSLSVAGDRVFAGGPLDYAARPRVVSLDLPTLSRQELWTGEVTLTTGVAVLAADFDANGSIEVAVGQPGGRERFGGQVPILSAETPDTTIPSEILGTFEHTDDLVASGWWMQLTSDNANQPELVIGSLAEDGTAAYIHALPAFVDGSRDEGDATRSLQLPYVQAEFGLWSAEGEGEPGLVAVSSGAVLWFEDWQGDATEADADRTWTVSALPYGYGHRVRAQGDLTGDGLTDLVLTAHTHEEPAYRAGRVYVLEAGNAPAGLLEDTPIQIRGLESGDAIGYSVATADVNGDGQDDLWVGSPGLQGEPRAGSAHLFLGPLSGILTPEDADYTVHGERIGDFFGREIQPADADGDDKADIVISASSWGQGRGAERLLSRWVVCPRREPLTPIAARPRRGWRPGSGR